MELEAARNLLAFPLQDEGAELSRRMFLFSVFTGLAFVDLQGLRASQIETNSEGKRYIRKARQKTEVESLIPLASDSGADTRPLHEGAEQRGLQDIPRYNERLEATPSSQSRGVGMWHPYSVDLALCKTYVRHANARGWCAYREYR